jgi:hypothetical protein
MSGECTPVSAPEGVIGSAVLPEAPFLPPTWKRKVIAGSLVVGSMTGLVTAIDALLPHYTSAHDTARSAAELYPDQPLPPRQEVAPAPSATSIAMVGRLFEQPANPDITNFHANTQHLYETALSETNITELEGREHFRIRKETAEKYGLQVFDPSETIDKLTDAQRPLPATEFMATANAYTRQYGMSIGRDLSLKYDYDTVAASKASLEAGGPGRVAVIGAVNAISKKPKQYFDMLGIKRVLLVEQAPDKRLKMSGYIYSSLTGNIGESFVLNVSSANTSAWAEEVTNHELRHREDELLTGSARGNDPSFADNKGDVPYGKVGPEPKNKEKPDDRPTIASKLGFLTLEEYEKQRQEIDNEFHNYYPGTPACQEAAAEAESQLEAIGEKTRFPSGYAATKLTEHKPEIPLTNPAAYKRFLEPHLPHLGTQLKEQLARLMDYSPRLARFFIAMAERPQTETFADICQQYVDHPELLSDTRGK